MFHIRRCLLICSMILTTAMCGQHWSTFRRTQASRTREPTTTQYPLTEPPRWRPGIGYQCKARGPYVGACKSQNKYDGELLCSSLACAAPPRRKAHGAKQNVLYAWYTGPAEDGTPCGQDKFCYNRECIFQNPSNAEQYDNGTIVDCIFPRRAKKDKESMYMKAMQNIREQWRRPPSRIIQLPF